MGKASKSSKTGLCTKEPILKVSLKVMGDIIGITEKPMKENGRME